ncbi:P-loop containing nucleoside triphosphate hydrolase protein [Roridomyces roridus]|uniref:P-loop containing nucleoside triphosphate hydrolase protein n=1 Tax=Roridomyces roridus TaxID=1738132 RepID=A0AAD7BF29_9AGAR|nr:P-loop containing nucleoside triphosphate hydrolase protein [Roridomyces roridus]
MYPSAFSWLLAISVLAYAIYTSPFGVVKSYVERLGSNPQVAELFRFIFLGTIVEAGRRLGDILMGFGASLLVVKAEFTTGDFAYDWVLHYLENSRVWNESRSFKVVARNALSRPRHSAGVGSAADGHPLGYFEPAQATPSLFRWKGHWLSIDKSTAGYAHYDTGVETGGTLIVRLWGRDRTLLDELVRCAREFYIESKVLPRRVEADKDPSGALITAHFTQTDVSHDWILEYLRSANALQNAHEFTISTKQSQLNWGNGPKDDVRYLPAQNSKQQFLFTSPNTGRSTWLQVVINPGQLNWSNNSMVGGAISITLHSSNREDLADLIECAKQLYLQNGLSRVTVHLTDNSGEWARTVTKSRRALSTLILPVDVKETLLADAKQFLDSEGWYKRAGIPHRRGYLLYGEPGTGKSSTIHALAGELSLEIYVISLASPAIDDYTLAKLVSDTPARCILLLEDIDCAFPSRDDNDEDDFEPILDKDGKPMPGNVGATAPRSQVTLSGLLNVLDSVSSEEGRLAFATTNHIENLDSALIRAGRMDVKIQYKFADSTQIAQVFKRFFPLPTPDQPESVSYTEAELDAHAAVFGSAIPVETYSIAQIQGYLLTRKGDPSGAVEGVGEWVKAQEEEKRVLAEMKQKKRAERARRRKERAEAAAAVDSATKQVLNGVADEKPSLNGHHENGVQVNGMEN